MGSPFGLPSPLVMPALTYWWSLPLFWRISTLPYYDYTALLHTLPVDILPLLDFYNAPSIPNKKNYTPHPFRLTYSKHHLSNTPKLSSENYYSSLLDMIPEDTTELDLNLEELEQLQKAFEQRTDYPPGFQKKLKSKNPVAAENVEMMAFEITPDPSRPVNRDLKIPNSPIRLGRNHSTDSPTKITVFTNMTSINKEQQAQQPQIVITTNVTKDSDSQQSPHISVTTNMTATSEHPLSNMPNKSSKLLTPYTVDASTESFKDPNTKPPLSDASRNADTTQVTSTPMNNDTNQFVEDTTVEEVFNLLSSASSSNVQPQPKTQYEYTRDLDANANRLRINIIRFRHAKAHEQTSLQLFQDFTLTLKKADPKLLILPVDFLQNNTMHHCIQLDRLRHFNSHIFAFILLHGIPRNSIP
jgi:hypothetical protein